MPYIQEDVFLQPGQIIALQSSVPYQMFVQQGAQNLAQNPQPNGSVFVTSPMAHTANAKARKLLNSLLSKAQQQELYESNMFRVRGGRTGDTYQIHAFGCTGNIRKVLFPGLRYKTFCLHINDYVPLEDHLIGQMLLIQYDEDRFLKIARG